MKNSQKYCLSGIDNSHLLADTRAMKNPRTTIFGSLAAVFGACAALPEITGAWHLVAIALAAASTALFAFFAKDAEAQPVRTTTVMLCLEALGAGVILCSCSIDGLSARATVPTLGDYSVTIAGGTIGNRPLTNATQVVITNTP